jgi:hypothetical protein
MKAGNEKNGCHPAAFFSAQNANALPLAGASHSA